MADGPIEIVDTEYWLSHWDELVDALHIAAELPEHEQAISPWWASRVTVVSPQWALEHLDELRAGLEEAAHVIGPEPQTLEPPPKAPSVRDMVRNAEPPSHDEDRGHGR